MEMVNLKRIENYTRVIGIVLSIIGFRIAGHTGYYDDGRYYVLAGIIFQIVALAAYLYEKKKQKDTNKDEH